MIKIISLRELIVDGEVVEAGAVWHIRPTRVARMIAPIAQIAHHTFRVTVTQARASIALGRLATTLTLLTQPIITRVTVKPSRAFVTLRAGRVVHTAAA